MRPNNFLKVAIALGIPLICFIAFFSSFSSNLSRISLGEARTHNTQPIDHLTTPTIPDRAEPQAGERVDTPSTPHPASALKGSTLALIALAARAAGAEVTVDSRADRVAEEREAGYRIAFEAETLEGLVEELTGIEIPAIGPIQGSALLSYADGDYRLTDLKLTIKGQGGVVVTGHGAITKLTAGKGIDLTMAMKADTVADIAAYYGGKLPAVDASAELTGVDLPSAGPVTVTWRVSDAGEDYRVSNIKASIKAGDAEATVTGSIAEILQLKGLDITVRMKASSLAAFSKMAGAELPALGPVVGSVRISDAKRDSRVKDINGQLTVGNNEATANGSIANLREGTGLELNVTVNAHTPSDLSSLAGTDLSALQPAQATARIIEADGAYRVEDIKGTLKAGNAEATLSGSVADLLEAKGVDIDIALQAKSLADLSELADTDLPDIGPLELTAKIADAEDAYIIKDITGSLTAETAQVTFTDGSISEPLAGRGLKLPVRLKADSLADLSKLAAADLPAVGPVEVAATVSDAPNGAWHLAALNAKVGKSDLSGKATVALNGPRPRVEADLTSRLIDLRAFVADVDLAPTKILKEGEAAEEAGTDYARIFPNDPISFEGLRAMDADITLEVHHFVSPKYVILEDVHGSLNLKEGLLIVKPFSAHAGGGSYLANIMIDARSDPPLIEFDIDIKDASMEQILKERYGEPLLSGGTTNVDLHWRGQGNSVRAFMGSLNGHFLLELENYRIDNKAAAKFRALDLRVGALLTDVILVIQPKAKEERYTTLICGVTQFYFKDGLAAFEKGIGAQTNQLDIIASGIINLKNEKLEIAFHPEARRGISLPTGALAKLVKVGGTLANPHIELDPAGLLGIGAYIGVGVVTFGTSVLARELLKKDAAKDPCETARESQLIDPKAAQEKQKGPIRRPIDTSIEAVKGVLGN
ncbi:MAG: AsmA family protein [Gammaproteobacteria bacterium]|nr:AsmA family protein [Gammaproteobacteria bacterium]